VSKSLVKRRKKKSGRVGDGTLQAYWRKAVLKEWHYHCALCGTSDNLQCHHIVKRLYKVLRNDWRNGIALCVKCHGEFHAGVCQLPPLDLGYLRERMMPFPQYLVEHGMSEAEFSHLMLADLKRKIGEAL
jgi:hypothetical protein